MLASLTGDGLLVSEGEEWRRHRQMAQPAFRREQIEGYGGFMVEHAQRLIAEWRDGQTRDIHADMSKLTLAIVAQALFTMNVDALASEVGRALEAALRFFASPISLLSWGPSLPLPMVVRYRRAVQRLNHMLYDIIRRRRSESEPRPDLLARLLAARDETGNPMTDEQLRNELMTLFLAGHETTALALTYTFYLLAQHAEAETPPAGRDRRSSGRSSTGAGRRAAPALHELGSARVDAAVSAGVEHRPRGDRRLRDRRLFRAARHADRHPAMGRSSGSSLVRRTRSVSTGGAGTMTSSAVCRAARTSPSATVRASASATSSR